jgi:hypothetical protein
MIAKYKLSIACLNSYYEEFIVLQSLNLPSLNLHFQDMLTYSNLILSHSFVFNETIVQFFLQTMKCTMQYQTNLRFYHVMKKHGTTIIYDDMVSLSNINLITNLGVKLILATFNKDYVFMGLKPF